MNYVNLGSGGLQVSRIALGMMTFGSPAVGARSAYQDSDHTVAAALSALAEQKGISNATVAYAWLLYQPGLTEPIVGARKVWQIEQAVQALDVSLSAEELSAPAAPYRPHPVLGHQ